MVTRQTKMEERSLFDTLKNAVGAEYASAAWLEATETHPNGFTMRQLLQVAREVSRRCPCYVIREIPTGDIDHMKQTPQGHWEFTQNSWESSK